MVDDSSRTTNDLQTARAVSKMQSQTSRHEEECLPLTALLTSTNSVVSAHSLLFLGGVLTMACFPTVMFLFNVLRGKKQKGAMRVGSLESVKSERSANVMLLRAAGCGGETAVCMELYSALNQ